MIKWAEKECQSFLHDYITEKNYIELYNYLWFWSMFHETEHCKQFLIGLRNYLCECDEISEVYGEIFKLMIDDPSFWHSIIPFYELSTMIKRFIYKRNENNLILERNANIFSFDYIIKIMEKDPNISKEMMQLFSALYTANLILGYEKKDDKVSFPIYKALKTVGKKKLADQLVFSSDLPIIMQMSYGLPIEESLIENIMTQINENQNDFVKSRNEIHKTLKRS